MTRRTLSKEGEARRAMDRHLADLARGRVVLGQRRADTLPFYTEIAPELLAEWNRRAPVTPRRRTLVDFDGEQGPCATDAEIAAAWLPMSACPRCGAAIEWEGKLRLRVISATAARDAQAPFVGRTVKVPGPPGKCPACALHFPFDTAQATGPRIVYDLDDDHGQITLARHKDGSGPYLRESYFNTLEWEGGRGPFVQELGEVMADLPATDGTAVVDWLITRLTTFDSANGGDPVRALVRRELWRELTMLFLSLMVAEGPHPRAEAFAVAVCMWCGGGARPRQVAAAVKRQIGDRTPLASIERWLQRLKRRMADRWDKRIGAYWGLARLIVGERAAGRQVPLTGMVEPSRSTIAALVREIEADACRHLSG